MGKKDALAAIKSHRIKGLKLSCGNALGQLITT